MVVLVRKNAKMSIGKTASQVAHAALGLYALTHGTAKPVEWHERIVVLMVTDRKFREAQSAHPEGFLVTDAGVTEVEPGTETAFAYPS